MNCGEKKFKRPKDYSKLPKDELVWNLEERKISHLKSWSKPQIIKRLEEDDKAQDGPEADQPEDQPDDPVDIRRVGGEGVNILLDFPG